jgi:1,2-phenylacetyl-CoA epoxidase PaaB subunit
VQRRTAAARSLRASPLSAWEPPRRWPPVVAIGIVRSGDIRASKRSSAGRARDLTQPEGKRNYARGRKASVSRCPS